MGRENCAKLLEAFSLATEILSIKSLVRKRYFYFQKRLKTYKNSKKKLLIKFKMKNYPWDCFIL